jgi:hypothetical protein
MEQEKLKQFAILHWLPLSGFLVSAGLALYFGFTFMADAIYFNDPRHKDSDLQGWMTPRYVTLSYDIPMTLVLDALGLDESVIGKGLRLEDIASDQGSSLQELTENIRAKADAYRESQID